MVDKFKFILFKLSQRDGKEDYFSIFNPTKQFDIDAADEISILKSLNAAFLIALIGEQHPLYNQAVHFISRIKEKSQWKDIAEFYDRGVNLIYKEIETVCEGDNKFYEQLNSLYGWISNDSNSGNVDETIEKVWTVFFPEGSGIFRNEHDRIQELRKKRIIRLTELNKSPVTNPIEQILFTSNILLTIPPKTDKISNLPLSEDLKIKLQDITDEPQLYWYDHPVQIGVKLQNNEILYGLQNLQRALKYEQEKGLVWKNSRLTCALSVSVTHKGLQNIAKKYIKEELDKSGGLGLLDIYIFTEIDTRRIIDEVFKPTAKKYLQIDYSENMFSIFGVDGEYGRHYNFLKVIAALFNIFINPDLKGTFKIDLDQVFPQAELVEQTGVSAFTHLMSELWGANGVDHWGEPVELGMIAGVLVNQRDIDKSIFTPDVDFPGSPQSPDEYIFMSTLPQALSTQAEMMTQYNSDELDGKNNCIQRIHVTGGTTGILVKDLVKYHPFVPSFIGRAEDQAYILSNLVRSGRKIAYLHKSGLIMRHDKEAFAQEAIKSSYAGKLISDYIRILYFSEYANVLTENVSEIKKFVDPFTGCFISRIPITVTLLRFALKTGSFFESLKNEEGVDFVRSGAKRINKALSFIEGENSMLKKQFKKEQFEWELFYKTLSKIEEGLKENDSFAHSLRDKMHSIIQSCKIPS